MSAPRIGVAPITSFSDSTYEPAETGAKAVILSIEGIDGEIADLVAFYHDAPQKWWLRLGEAVALGEQYLDACQWAGEAALLVATPLEWIEVRGKAVCILDWRADLHGLLSRVPYVRCSTPALAYRLKKATSRPRLDIRIWERKRDAA